MPNQKIVLKYVQYGTQWEELFYGQADGVPQMMAALDNAFLAAAVFFRQQGTYMSSVRVQDVAQPRVALLKRLPPSSPVLTANDADVVGVAAKWTLRDSTAALQRTLNVRGLEDRACTRDGATGRDIPSDALLTYMASYINHMNRVGLYIRALLPITGVSPYDFYDIISITVAAGGGVTLTTDGLVPLSASGRIILSQFDPKDWPGLNGAYRARNVAAPTFNVRYKSHLAPGVYPVSKGRYRVEEYRYLRIDKQEPDGRSAFNKLGTRSTKDGPFGGRGAKRAVRLRSR